MKVKRSASHFRPLPEEKVTVKETGNVTEIMYQSRANHKATIKRLSESEYIYLATGEIREFKRAENKLDTLTSVYRSLSLGRDLINTNVTDFEKTLWVTLTYKENMQDTQRLKNDFKEFNRKLRAKYGQYEYITAAEPQARGAWHLHAFLIFDKKAPFIPNKDLADIWGQGFVKIKALPKNLDNPGAYLSAYLIDIEIEQKDREVSYDKEVKTIEVDEKGNQIIKSKKYIKGERLHFYPPNMRIFRWSNGIKKPVITVMRELEAKEKVSAATLTFEKTSILQDESNDFVSTLNKRYYNSKK